MKPSEMLKRIEDIREECRFEGNEDFWHEGLDDETATWLINQVKKLTEALESMHNETYRTDIELSWAYDIAHKALEGDK